MRRPFKPITSKAVPLLRANIDTDAIIPSREMKTVSKQGLSGGLFAGWRYHNARDINPDFVLNNPDYNDAKILLAGENFGCGSSREHAVWALAEYGFRVIVAPSFGSIFYDNCIQNGVLPIRLSDDHIKGLAEPLRKLMVDLTEQTIDDVPFDISREHKKMLLEGLDAIDLSLEYLPDIERFEQQDTQNRSWVSLE
jgi:3-isopropylmalate/(R)-2-methylmalate dehydratase small subunit